MFMWTGKLNYLANYMFNFMCISLYRHVANIDSENTSYETQEKRDIMGRITDLVALDMRSVNLVSDESFK